MQVNKYQITLTPQESAILALNPFNISVPEYIKFVARQAVVSIDNTIPIFKISRQLEQKLEKGMKEYQTGKAKVLLKI